jgi:hypothetical protein
MNELIKELAVQAGAGEWGDSVIAATMDIEKFAELIVIECASICYNSGLKDPDTHAQNLMFHFNIDNCRNDK